MNGWLHRLWDRVFRSEDLDSQKTEDLRFEASDFVREPNKYDYGLFGESSCLYEEIPNRDVSDVVSDWLDEMERGSLRR